MSRNSSSDLQIDFMFVGVPRSATTWFYKVLQEHPEVCVPKKKEFMPFDTDGNIRDSLVDQFLGCNKKKKGMFPISFFIEKGSADVIKKNFPNTKIIFCIRNPIERAYSHYQYLNKKGSLKTDTFEQAINDSLNINGFLKYGFYAKALERYIKVFEKNLLVIQYSDFKKNPKHILEITCKFIGITKPFKSKYISYYINQSNNRFYKTHVISKFTQFIYKKSSTYQQSIFGRRIVSFVKSIGGVYILDWIISQHKVPMSKNEKTSRGIKIETTIFLEKYYYSDIVKTKEIINRNIVL